MEDERALPGDRVCLVSFSDLPGDERMRLRGILEAFGCEVQGYGENGVQVALPRSMRAYDWPRIGPFELVPGSAYDFPLGSDHPPAHLRHDTRAYGPTVGESSMWHLATYRLGAEVSP